MDPLTLTLQDDGRKLRFDIPARLADRALLVPGLSAHKDPDGTDYFAGPPAWPTLLAIGAEFGETPGFSPDSALDPIVDYYLAREAYAAHLRAEPAKAWDPHLYPYQRTGVRWLADLQRSGLTDEMGTGKTVMALAALHEADAYPALVVAPTSMTHVWAQEATTWAPGCAVFVIEGDKRKRDKTMAEAVAAHEDAGLSVVVITGWGLLPKITRFLWYGGAKALTAAEKSDGLLQELPWQTVIADEAHRIKDPTAKRTMALKGVAAHAGARNRWALTGTPLSNHPGDVWSILHFLDPDEWPSRSKFYTRWVELVETQWGMRPVAWKRERRAEIDRLLGLYFLRRTKAEVLPELPEKTYQVRELAMGPTQAKVYKDLVEDMMATIGDDEILVATDPLSLLTRLSQAASASLVVEDGEVTALGTPSCKLDALSEILEEMPEQEQVVVFAESRKLLELAAEQDQFADHVMITGEVTPEQRAFNIARFQRGEVRIAFVTLGAGAEGITLTAASTAVFLQRSYSMVKNLQAEDRIHRAGQDANKVLIIDLVSAGTVDEAVIRTAQRKEDLLIDTLQDRERLQALAKGE